jgi:hypothetical protein
VCPGYRAAADPGRWTSLAAQPCRNPRWPRRSRGPPWPLAPARRSALSNSPRWPRRSRGPPWPLASARRPASPNSPRGRWNPNRSQRVARHGSASGGHGGPRLLSALDPSNRFERVARRDSASSGHGGPRLPSGSGPNRLERFGDRRAPSSGHRQNPYPRLLSVPCLPVCIPRVFPDFTPIMADTTSPPGRTAR